MNISIALDRNFRFAGIWINGMGHPMAVFIDGDGDEIVFEISDSSAAEEFKQAAKYCREE
jgi:hypothetical protein